MLALALGPELEGDSGFVTLRHRKAEYWQRRLWPEVEEAWLQARLSGDASGRVSRDLLAFYGRRFNETGSLALGDAVDAERDAALTWATRGCRYVKRDRLYRSLEVAIENARIWFDASALEHRRATEKRTLCYELREVDSEGGLTLAVRSQETGDPTDLGEVARQAREAGVSLSDRALTRAVARFERQAEADHLLRPGARRLLDDRLDAHLAGCLLEAGLADADRPGEIAAARAIGRAVNAAIGRLEDSLIALWDAPRPVWRITYVVTLDRVCDRDPALLERLAEHPGWPRQIQDWRELGLMGDALATPTSGLPLDTAYFPDLQDRIVAAMGDLEAALDGYLIKSDNSQALGTFMSRFEGKIQTCYVDPPYNTAEESFSYVDRLPTSTWLTMMDDRLRLARRWLRPDGTIFVQVDCHETATLKLLLDEIFGKDNLLNEIIWRIGWVSGFKTRGRRFVRNHETLWGYAMGPDYVFDKEPLAMARGRLALSQSDEQALEQILTRAAGGRLAERKAIVRTVDGRPLYYPLPTRDDAEPAPYALEDVWNASEYDELHSIKIMSYSGEKIGDDRDRNSTQKPEKLLARLIGSASRPGDLVLDFFCGTGTTLAAAHKLGRRWIGMELSEGAFAKARDRMKTVLAGRSKKGASRLGKRYGEPCGISRSVSWKGGGAFACLELASFEEALRTWRPEL